ncbi:MAG: maleylpyruvate isomerase family mycothiol-dependent enzyme [Burkholderiaceae bacterium]|nr:maleylpyruvate isomerase family mycothiol-dependent enzyme [Microbacteriaceae bacterium]
MSDFAQHLPLSQRSAEDESGVTGDWRPLIAECLAHVADLLEPLTAEQWESASLCEGWRVADVAGHLAWRVGTPAGELLTSSVRAVVRERVSPRALTTAMAERRAANGQAALVAELRAIAGDRAVRRGRRNIGELAEVVIHGYDMATALGIPLEFPARATGAVALARTLLAPARLRAVVRHRTLRATDAGWSVGRGPEIAAPAEALVLFLAGRSNTVPSQ